MDRPLTPIKVRSSFTKHCCLTLIYRLHSKGLAMKDALCVFVAAVGNEG